MLTRKKVFGNLAFYSIFLLILGTSIQKVLGSIIVMEIMYFFILWLEIRNERRALEDEHE